MEADGGLVILNDHYFFSRAYHVNDVWFRDSKTLRWFRWFNGWRVNGWQTGGWRTGGWQLSIGIPEPSPGLLDLRPCGQRQVHTSVEHLRFCRL